MNKSNSIQNEIVHILSLHIFHIIRFIALHSEKKKLHLLEKPNNRVVNKNVNAGKICKIWLEKFADSISKNLVLYF